MFTGIIETLGSVRHIKKYAGNVEFGVECNFLHELVLGQSIAHNGVCLTVTHLFDDYYTVTAIDETLNKTNLGALKVGEYINLERCMPASGRFDGHIVQGHVDCTGICKSVSEENGSWEFEFIYSDKKHITISKGSICINGVSLTVVNSTDDSFSVAIIPYTFEHTNFKNIKSGSSVNLEFDVIGKYIQKIMAK